MSQFVAAFLGSLVGAFVPAVVRVFAMWRVSRAFAKWRAHHPHVCDEECVPIVRPPDIA